MKFSDLKECPFCGFDDYYYTKEYTCRTVYYVEQFDGEETYNKDMFANPKNYSGKCYCR